MRTRLSTVLSVIGAATVLVLAANTIAFAATGQPLLLGKSNSANNVTALTRTTSGTGLKIQTKSSTNPPLAVNGKARVANLNADRVDNLEGTSLQTRPIVYSLPTVPAHTTNFTINFPNLTPGLYQGSYSLLVIGGPVNCSFRYSAGASVGTAYGAVNSTYSQVNNTAVVDTRTRPVQLYCWTSNTMSLYTAASPQVIFTRLDAVTNAAGTVGTPN